MLKLNSQLLAQTLDFTLAEDLPEAFSEWRIKLFHKDGGIKKDWFLSQYDCPISKITIELNKKICGAGSIEFSFVDFPLDGGDGIEIFFKGIRRYVAKLESTVDPKGGVAKLIPLSTAFQNRLINPTYTTQTIDYILEDIITNIQDETKILWNPFLVNTGDIDTYTLDYSGYDTPQKIIDGLVGKLNDREWGVTQDYFFTVYTPEQTVTETLFNNFNPAFSELKVKKEYSKVKATRYQVFKKVSGSGESVRIGQVGYGSGYPILSIEDEIGDKREKKFNISEIITDNNEAVDIAYNNLISQAVVPINASMKNVDLDRYFPRIGQMIKAQDKVEYIRRDIINCNQLTNDDTTIFNEGRWIGASLDEDDSVSGGNSITFIATNTGDGIYYDFMHLINFFQPEKIGFMIKSNMAGNYLEYSTGETLSGSWSDGTWSSGTWSESSLTSTDLWYTTNNIDIPNGNLWYYVQFPIISGSIRYFGIRTNATPLSTVQINIDRVDLYLPHRDEIEANVIMASIDIERDGYNCNLTLNQYDIFANDAEFEDKRKIEKLEAIQQQ